MLKIKYNPFVLGQPDDAEGEYTVFNEGGGAIAHFMFATNAECFIRDYYSNRYEFSLGCDLIRTRSGNRIPAYFVMATDPEGHRWGRKNSHECDLEIAGERIAEVSWMGGPIREPEAWYSL